MAPDPPTVLVLTPVKQAARHLDGYFAALAKLSHPREGTSLGFLEGDSTDDTYARLEARLPELRSTYRRVTLVRHDFHFHIPEGVPRWAPPLQFPRRVVLAKARNRLLMTALADEEWVLWLDVDVADYPADILEQLLAAGKDIVTPHCVTRYGGPTFDWNAWRDKGRVRMDALRGGPDLVRLDAVGGTMLLVRADLHREGLVFPPYLYGRQSRFARTPSPFDRRGPGEVETEGLGIMAKDMGHECWGMPNLERAGLGPRPGRGGLRLAHRRGTGRRDRGPRSGPRRGHDHGPLPPFRDGPRPHGELVSPPRTRWRVGGQAGGAGRLRRLLPAAGGRTSGRYAGHPSGVPSALSGEGTMDDEALEREVLDHVDESRRSFVKRLVVGTAFAVPIVTSFDMSSLTMSSAGAQTYS